ncbi:hypothetical protein ASG89_25225 [Paenibacillus sp. Soil766]|uniref:hypothetical protein n=1 Tax=Paenibacillus sp. Soil766 TaxID=1736404 RepID=UPI0007102F17|nr:hypothetical protein [Paenibacillus sp. Soil766]KRF01669.1 hypothetical protein ASG89_25225 [Paenibacillus sp. Soil766]
MSIAIGLRVAPKVIYYSIVRSLSDDSYEVIVIDKIKIPEALDDPRKLSYLRTTLLSIIMEFEINKAGVRIAEGTAQSVSNFRIYLEGVIQELFANSSVEKYFLATKTKLARCLNQTNQTITDYIEGKNDFLGIPDIGKSHSEKRESILTAIASLEQ